MLHPSSGLFATGKARERHGVEWSSGSRPSGVISLVALMCEWTGQKSWAEGWVVHLETSDTETSDGVALVVRISWCGHISRGA